MKNKMIKLMNKRVNGQSYLVNKYGIHLGMLADAYLYTETHEKNTYQMRQSLNMIIGISKQDYEEINKIIKKELELIKERK